MREKKRLEKINEDLSKKLMETLKDKEKDIRDEQDKLKKKSEHQIAYLSDEMN